MSHEISSVGGSMNSSTELVQVVSQQIHRDKQSQKTSILIPAGFFGGITTILFGTGLVSGVPLDGIMQVMALSVPLLGSAAVGITASFLSADTKESVRKTLATTEHGAYDAIKKSRTNRVLVNSFSIKEKSEVDINEWIDPHSATLEERPTHIVNQYLVKEKRKFRVEQEIIPNSETIWDISADALVEVYGVHEKTDSMKGITA